jgi:hypothetical protein
MDIGVAEAFRMGEDGDARFLHHPQHQALAAARHDQVDQPRRAQHGGDEGTVGGGGDLHRRFRQPRRAQPFRHAGMDRERRPQAFLAPAQDHRAARLQAEPAGIGGDVGAAFIDHADHADRLRDALDEKPVRPRPFRQHPPDRIGQRRNLLKPRRHRGDARRRQGQAVAIGGAEIRRGGEILGIRGDQRIGARAQRIRGGAERGILLRPWRDGQRMGSPPRGAGGMVQQA